MRKCGGKEEWESRVEKRSGKVRVREKMRCRKSTGQTSMESLHLSSIQKDVLIVHII